MTHPEARGTRYSVPFLCALLLLSTAAIAAPLQPEEVPEALRPWISWVLRGAEAERCPFLNGTAGSEAPGCAWPATLELDLDPTHGSFKQRWRVYTDALVPLPGDSKRWPLDVSVDGQPAPVVDRGGHPSVELSPGSHEVRGRFSWDTLPELLAIPPASGLVRLRLRGKNIDFPNRDAPNRIWLERRVVTDAVEDSRLEVVVHRRVIDEIPLRIETRIELRVAGRAHEALLGSALPDDFVAMSLRGPLPARLDPDGRLRVQVRPGTWVLTLVARHVGPVAQLAMPAQGESLSGAGDDWAPEEVWAFDARPNLRLVDVGGVAIIDPSQTTLPDAWKQLPTYLMTPDSVLQLKEKRRGDQDPAPDDLRLRRTWWLDFDGRGFTISDEISGNVRRSTRLEMSESVELGRVALDAQDQLITRVESSRGAGVEIPLGPIALTADARIPGTDGLTAVSWEHDFQQLDGELWLPPGWRLFHASGVDRASTTWLNRWTLLDLFVVLVTAMAVFRLWGPRWGVLAVFALALGYTEPGAPRWLWIAALVGEGLHRALPEGAFARIIAVYRMAALAVLLLVSLAFGIAQVRIALHPTLERPGSFIRFDEPAQIADTAEMEGEALEMSKSRIRVRSAAKSDLRALGYVDSSPAQRYARYAPDPQARITTGPGLPDWSWGRVQLSWSGPVDRDQPVHFSLIPPWLGSLLGFLRVGLLAALVLRFAGISLGSGPGPVGPWLRQAATAKALLLVVAIALASGGAARADPVPRDSLLTELRARLLAKPECYPNCATISKLRIEVDSATLTLRLQADIAADTAIPLPGGAKSWGPTSVVVDGNAAQALRRDERGVLWLQLPAGPHRVVARGPLPDRDSIDLPLPLQPHRVEAEADGWEIHGLREDGLAESTLQLTRIDRGTTTEVEAGELPPFLTVVRKLELGLDWRLQTTVIRQTPNDAPIVIEVPLLPGESVTSGHVRVKDRKALVNLQPGESELSWSSELEERHELALHAPEGGATNEVWQLDASPIWHVEAEGIPPVHAGSGHGARIREWRPWPGESVRLAIARPPGVEGTTLTIDSSVVTLTPGLRSTDATLVLGVRSSRGGRHSVELPIDAELQHVSIDGRVQPIRQEGRNVSLPLRPGKQQIELIWRERRGLTSGLLFKTPEIGLGIPSVNTQLVLNSSIGRWILAIGGPSLGPAVLFWSLLVAFGAVAFGLGRLNLTPIRFHEWLLLAVGLTQITLAGAATVVGWLVLLGWRRGRGASLSKFPFDFLQLALVALSVGALYAMYSSIQQGLLGNPEMQISGNGSNASLLRWYQDRSETVLPIAWIFSVPVIVYRLAMLAWALWLAQALLRWLRWGWECFSTDQLWLPLRTPPPTPPPPVSIPVDPPS